MIEFSINQKKNTYFSQKHLPFNLGVISLLEYIALNLVFNQGADFCTKELQILGGGGQFIVR
jgi:hypothetical protein